MPLSKAQRDVITAALACAEFERCAITPDSIAQTIALARPFTSSTEHGKLTEQDRAAAKVIYADMTRYVDTWIAHRLRCVLAHDRGELPARDLQRNS